MSKYQFKIEIDGVDLTDATVAPFTITNGRNSFDAGFVRWSANLALFKKAAQSILSTAGANSESLTAGNQVIISVFDSTENDYVTMFRGPVTSTTSNARQYQLTAVDEVYWALTAEWPFAEPTDQNFPPAWAALAMRDGTNSLYNLDFDVDLDYIISRVPAFERTDRAQFISQFAKLTNYALAVLKPVDDRGPWPPVPEILEVGTIYDPDVSTVVVAVTDAMVEENYNLIRNSADLYNYIKLNYNSGTDLPEINDLSIIFRDNTSINKFGIKQLTVDTYGSFDDPYTIPGVQKIGYATLQRNSQWGWQAVEFQTSADKLGLSNKALVTDLIPNSVIDTSAVTVEEFQDKQVVQQITHICSPDYWQLSVFAANYRFVSPPQTWGEVDGSLEWGDVPSNLTWDMILAKDL
jgi:hypothetical protein